VEKKSFVEGLVDILQDKFDQKDFNQEDILRCMGIKRTNANTLDSINLEGGVALYATYTLVSLSMITLNGNCAAKLDICSRCLNIVLNQGWPGGHWPDFSAYRPNFIKILYCGSKKNLGLFFFKYDMIDVSLGRVFFVTK